ncbi:major facilitator super transporter protein [Podila minutissima]|uniref:GPI ethanolamine phosphate transferase 2 n=1 Tax=Podila minutissima TaxID=64525 RepID=A0A9P5VK59_9FUNG|nr:major facilitator super transporter protein [Podila minutissima]
MRPWILYCILLASSVCQMMGLVMFAKGFFPYKSISTAFAAMDDLPVLPFTGASPGTSGPEDNGSIRPRYGKVVLMLVDALRSLIDANQALPFTALASAPTVTLPRLKALTTGTVPSFLDAILNIAESDQSSTLANQDNWIAQLTRSKSLRKNHDTKQRNIGFFGDDTWIKLFPGQFFRSEGTSSFFAMDTVEVDNNVTRHVQPELAKNDWDALIFHYLGLDHVGHSGGPKSGLMRPKQAEMDSIVKTIFSALTDQQQDGDLPTLFILCGDHGMNEVGNHGGSSRSEISTAFLFMSPHFQQPATSARIKTMVDPYRLEGLQDQEEYQYYKSVNQVDLVPTISLLLGLPIPKNSVGKLIPELFDEYSDLEKLRALQINAFQVAEVLKGKWSDFETEAAALLSTYSPIDEQGQDSDDHAFEACARMDSEKQRLSCWYTEALAAHASLLEMNIEGSHIHYKDHDKVARFRAAEKSYSKFLSDSSSMLSTALSKYDMPLLTNGSLVMAFAVAGFMYCAMQTKLLSDLKRSCRETNAVNPKKSTSTIIYTSPDTAPLPSVSNFAVPKPLLKTPFASLTAGDANEIDWTLARGLSAVIFILYLVTLFASSFVEEEHQFWYFFNMSWWAVLGITSARYLVPASSCRDDKFDFKPYLAAGYCFAQMGILRVLRAWNQTGQKYADQIDLRHYLNSTWLGVSWIVFGATMVTIALSLISMVYNFQQRTKQQYQEAWRKNNSSPSSPGPVTTVLQALLVILVVLVTFWITLYKMDLESDYFGDQFMAQVHSVMIRISAVGYSQISALPLEERPSLTVSGFELARGCYFGLGLILVLTLTLKGLDSSPTPAADTSSREGAYYGALTDKDAALKVVQGKPQALFVPAMILGVATLLLVLLSRRHNAPIYVLFGVQLWMYTEWISLIRQRPSYSDHEVSQLSNPLAEKTKSNVYVVEPLAQDSGDVAGTTTIAPKPAPILDLAFRTLPGQSSIHSCTALLWVLSSFFLLGNSNSIASIDISNAYVGIQAYDIFLTGVLTFVSNWAGPIWWALATVVMMSWDLEWELAWTAQASELEHVQEEEQAWETVQGWRVSKDDKKSGMSRRTRRRVIREKKWKTTSKEHESVTTAAATDDGAAKEETNMIGEIVEVKPDASGAIIEDSESVEEKLKVSQGEVVEDNNAGERDQVEEEIEYLEEVSSDEPPSATLARLGAQGYRVHLAQTRMMEHLILSSLFFGIALYALSIAAIVLRHHLFIWTVFSPKVLYQFAWTALFQIVIQTVVVGGGVWALVLFI